MGKLYQKLLAEIPGVEWIYTDLNEASPWLYDIMCEDRQGLMNYLREKKIGTRDFYPALHKEPAYDYKKLSFPFSEIVASRCLWLPSSVTLTDEDITYVCDCVRKYHVRG